MSFPYVPINYVNGSTSTPLNDVDLNKNDGQVKALTDALMVFSRMGPCGSRPAANTVRPGGLYACTDTGTLYESDGASTWTAVATSGGGGSTGAIGVPVNRLVVYGHSYANYDETRWPGSGWVRNVAALLGILSRHDMRQVPLPATPAGSDTTVLLYAADDDCCIERVSYQPNSPGITSGRVFKLSRPTPVGWDVVQNMTFPAIADPTNGPPAFTAINNYDLRDIVNMSQNAFGAFGAALWHDNAGNLRNFSGNLRARDPIQISSQHAGSRTTGAVVAVTADSTIMTAPNNTFTSADVGAVVSGLFITSPGTTIVSVYSSGARAQMSQPAVASGTAQNATLTQGIVDPGGILTVQLGLGVRNYAIGGAKLAAGGIFGGGWSKAFAQHPKARGPSTAVNVQSTSGGNTLTVDGLSDVIQSGTIISFRGGVSSTLSATVQRNAFTLPVNSTTGVVAGMQGWSVDNSRGIVGDHVAVLNWGINDAGANATFDAQAWGQALRSVTALNLCPYHSLDDDTTAGVAAANIVYANGTGGGSWATANQPAGGKWNLAAKTFTGGVAGNPSITIDVGPAFEGGTLDLFFYAIAGVNHGGAATILVDNASPMPGGQPCRIDTHNVTTTTGVQTFTNATVAAGNTSITGVGGIQSDDTGGYVYGNGIQPLTYVASTNSSGTPWTVTPAPTAGGNPVTLTLCDVIPMVKRIPNLSAGAHSVKITVTSVDASTGAFIFAGYGWEANNPTAPVVICNCARIPNAAGYGLTQAQMDTNVAALNTETANVLAGTSAVTGTNTVEPALASSVVVADINTALGPANPVNFGNDGIHPNLRGAALLAATVATTIRSNFTLAQTGAR